MGLFGILPTFRTKIHRQAFQQANAASKMPPLDPLDRLFTVLSTIFCKANKYNTNNRIHSHASLLAFALHSNALLEHASFFQRFIAAFKPLCNRASLTSRWSTTKGLYHVFLHILIKMFFIAVKACRYIYIHMYIHIYIHVTCHDFHLYACPNRQHEYTFSHFVVPPRMKLAIYKSSLWGRNG